MKRLIGWHRKTGIIACVGLLAWGLSGMMHPIMSRLQPQPANQAPPSQRISLRNALPLAQVLRQAGIARIVNAHVVRLDGRDYYQVILPDRAEHLYFGLQDGKPRPDADQRYAERLARHYLNDTRSRVLGIDLLSAHTDEYGFINRYLPVYRVRFDRPDGMRAYVATEGGRLGTLVDQNKGLLSFFFNHLHTWTFLKSHPEWKRLMLIFLVAAGIAGVTGLRLYVGLGKNAAQRLKRQPLRRFHRTLGLAVSLTTLTFALSGGYHLVYYSFRTDPHPDFHPVIQTAELENALPAAMVDRPINALGLAKIGNDIHYQVDYAQASQPAPAGASASAFDPHAFHQAASGPPSPASVRSGGADESPVLYVSAKTGKMLFNGDPAFARRLAGFYSGFPSERIQSMTRITQFNDEYGFIFKRLPVFRVAYNTPGQDVYFIDTLSGSLAAHLNHADIQEGKTFSGIHKWMFIPSKDARDGLTMMFAFGNALMALTGLWLLRPRRVQEKRP